jgi:hypothetical protein
MMQETSQITYDNAGLQRANTVKIDKKWK